MAKPTYLVTMVHPGKEAQFQSFLKRKAQPPPGDATYLAADGLVFVQAVRASNRREALVLAKALHPGLAIAPKIIKRAARSARR